LSNQCCNGLFQQVSNYANFKPEFEAKLKDCVWRKKKKPGRLSASANDGVGAHTSSLPNKSARDHSSDPGDLQEFESFSAPV
jgi:hypothetical protein